MPVGRFLQGQNPLADFRQLAGRAQLVRRAAGQAVFVLLHDARHPDHEKFVQVVVKDSQKFQLFQQRKARIQRLVKHPGVEFQPAQFAVQIQIRAAQIFNRRGAAPRVAIINLDGSGCSGILGHMISSVRVGQARSGFGPARYDRLVQRLIAKISSIFLLPIFAGTSSEKNMVFR